nr:hypothetical protein [Tanacetum cinerariifolium]
MNAPRENDPTELDRFKRDIDLVDYAQRQGYEIKKESRRGDWHHLVKDDEHVIVTRKGDHQVYLNTGDDRDAGSIIDFAKTRGGDGHGLNLGQKNEHYKSLLPLPKNGIWVSHPTEGKDTPVERIVVSESAIDSLSHYQLKHGQDPRNTLYVATSGTPTEAQIALIQRVIDKQEPKEVVLANDRDAGGRQFNINYLNELQPARPFVPVGEQAAYKEATRPVEWHATSDKYHVSLKVSFQHDTAEQGAQQLEVVAQELYRQREQLRPEAERQQSSFLRVDYPLAKDFNQELEYTRQGLTAEQIRAEAQREEQQRELERQQRLAETQRQQREQREQERQQAQAQREASPEAQRARQEDDRQFTQAVVGAAVASAANAEERPFRSYRTEQEAAEHTAQFVHARDAGLVLLKEYISDNPPPTGRKVDEAEVAENRDRARFTAAQASAGATSEEKTATWKIDELAANTTGRAEAWKEVLDKSGYSMQTSEIRSTVDEQGIRRAEFDMTYRNDQPDIAIIHAIVTNTNERAAAGLEKFAGVSVAESEAARAACQVAAEAAAIQPHNRDRSLDVLRPAFDLKGLPQPGDAYVAVTSPAQLERTDEGWRITERGQAGFSATKMAERGEVASGPTPTQGADKQVIIRVDEPAPVAGSRGQAEAVKEAVTASGAKAGDMQSTVDAQGIRHSEIQPGGGVQ